VRRSSLSMTARPVDEVPEPRAVTLDVWHTLLYLEPSDEEEYLARQLETRARLLESWPRSPKSRHPPIRDPRRAAAEAFEEAVNHSHRGITLSLATQATHAARRLGRVARPLELARGLAEVVERTNFQVSPGAIEMLERLEAMGIRRGVVSNTVGEPGESVQRILDRQGLGEYIEAWAFSDQLPWTKPAPEIFWHCLGMLSTRRERAVHVGDGRFDMLGARAAGLRAGILYTGLREYGERYRQLFGAPPDELEGTEYRIDRLNSVPDLVKTLLPD
jgi:HAD superfamily hydrolase (TIGR01549 family)